jgi:DNA-binding response OmpR family regulator
MGEPAAPKVSILVVDDDADLRGLIALALRRAGLSVLEANDGAMALSIIATEVIGVVVCDVGMPGMSGIEVVKELRARPETSTLPVILMTGSADEHSVVAGLEAGATDFLPKPIRLDELVARVRAHLRTQSAWSNVLQDELALRSGVVAALGSLTLSAVPEETAEAVVQEISRRTDSGFVSVAQISDQQRMQELATFSRRDGIRRGGETFSLELAGYLLGRARGGPWVEAVTPTGATPTASLRNANVDLVASAPIFSGDELVGLLSIGGEVDANRSARDRSARLLSAAIDYASVLSVVAGASIAGRLEASAQRARLESILEYEAFYPVFQPIVAVETRDVVGFEALTRFEDGMRPDLRFGEASRAGLGAEFELAALEMAVRHLDGLAPGFVSLNISPRSVIDHAAGVRSALQGSGRATHPRAASGVRKARYQPRARHRRGRPAPGACRGPQLLRPANGLPADRRRRRDAGRSRHLAAARDRLRTGIPLRPTPASRGLTSPIDSVTAGVGSPAGPSHCRPGR